MHRTLIAALLQVVEFTTLPNLQVQNAAQNAGFGAQAGCKLARRSHCGVVKNSYPPVAYIREEVESFVLTWELHGLGVIEGTTSNGAASGVGAAMFIERNRRRILGIRFGALVHVGAFVGGPAVVGPRYAAVYLLPGPLAHIVY